MSRDRLPRRRRENPQRARFRAMVNGWLQKHPNELPPPLSSYARAIGTYASVLRPWAKADFPDIYEEHDEWKSANEIIGQYGIANKAANERSDPPPFDLPPADPDAIRQEEMTR